MWKVIKVKGFILNHFPLHLIFLIKPILKDGNSCHQCIVTMTTSGMLRVELELFTVIASSKEAAQL